MKYACAVMLFLTSLSVSAEEKKSGTTKEHEAAYENAVKKCQPQSGPEKQKCIEAAKEKHGEMLK